MSSLTFTTTEAMLANFPEMVTGIVGEPILRKLICILNTHLTACAQSHMATVSPIKLPHLCLLPDIYQQYTAAPYPDTPMDPGPWDDNGEPMPLGQTSAKTINAKSSV